jgi:hypothetical protein
MPHLPQHHENYGSPTPVGQYDLYTPYVVSVFHCLGIDSDEAVLEKAMRRIAAALR